MLALAQVMLPIASDVVVHEHQQPLQSIVEVLLSHHRIGAEQYLVLLGHVGTVYELVAHDQLDVISLESEVVLQ